MLDVGCWMFRLVSPMDRIRIYQLLPRLFGNVNETRRRNGTLADNGVGKFADINDTALSSLRAMGFTHLWLTGVQRQATGTDYSAAGLPADDPDLLKGLAGSPFAVTDLFDVCPDYAIDPAQRLAEFLALLRRIRAHGLHVILDFIANHVARSYYSRVRPNLNFGTLDDRGKFFDPRNNFYYLRPDSPGAGPPLRLPTFADDRPISATCRVLGGCDGRFDSERDHGRVTGNNAATWTPGISDWYETVKLNYGYDFISGAQEYPTAEHPEKPVPDTWMKMDAVLAYWQGMGVDGFRCDMAHMVPPEFWQWLVARARARQREVFFAGEAYNNDPMKVGHGNVLRDLLAAGFDAVYDDPTYKILKGIYDGPKWANDLDDLIGDPTLFTRSLRYAENHDEVRLAGANQWGGIGMQVGRPVTALLFGLSRGPVLLYSGQEVGEPAQGAEGFGADDARTSIFDYWSMPELVKWVNDHRYDGGRLSIEQKELRVFYARLLALINEPAFRDGGFFGLNPANIQNARYGRLPGESASGHWLFAFLRYDATTGQRFLVLVNLHRQETFRNIDLWLPREALQFLELPVGSAWELRDQLASEVVSSITANIREEKGSILQISECRPLSACYFAWHRPPTS